MAADQCRLAWASGRTYESNVPPRLTLQVSRDIVVQSGYKAEMGEFGAGEGLDDG
jgi:hypothetical protein